MGESKREKFDRLAESRKLRLVREIRLISNLSNTKNYEYDRESVNELFQEFEKALDEARERFERNLSAPKRGESNE